MTTYARLKFIISFQFDGLEVLQLSKEVISKECKTKVMVETTCSTDYRLVGNTVSNV